MAYITAQINGCDFRSSDWAYDYWGGGASPLQTEPLSAFLSHFGTDIIDWFYANDMLHQGFEKRIGTVPNGVIYVYVSSYTADDDGGVPNRDWLVFRIRFYDTNSSLVYESPYMGIRTKWKKDNVEHRGHAYISWGLDENNHLVTFGWLYSTVNYNTYTHVYTDNVIVNRPLTGSTPAYNFLYGSIGELDLDPYSIGGNAGIGGGNGQLDLKSDTISPPTLPTKSAVGSGFMQLFTPTDAQLIALASYLWTDNFLTNLVKIKNDPFDIIISLNAFPFNVTAGLPQEIKAGNVSTGVSANVATNQFEVVNCGTVTVTPFYDSYLDFDPFTKCEIFLPYVGCQPISMDDIMGKTVGVEYRIDILTGGFIAYITVDGSIMYTFNGTCGINIPLTGSDYSSLYQSIISLAASAASLGMANMPAMGAAGAAGAEARSAYASNLRSEAVSSGVVAATTKPDIRRAGNISSNTGVLGPQKPFFIFKVPRVSLPKNSMQLTGYPLNAREKLSNLSGYTQVQAIKYTGMTCQESDLAEIDGILKNGFYIEKASNTKVTRAGSITLYQNKSFRTVMNKNLTLITTLDGTFRASVNLQDIEVTIEYDPSMTLPNYIYVADLDRWFFVESISIPVKNIMTLSCHCDVLETFKDSILLQEAIVEKQENKWNLYLNDGTFKTYQNPYVVQKEFPSGFSTTTMDYVIAVTGSP